LASHLKRNKKAKNSVRVLGTAYGGFSMLHSPITSHNVAQQRHRLDYMYLLNFILNIQIQKLLFQAISKAKYIVIA
jgi:hypothetical protein